MRFKLHFQLENETLDIDYRRIFLSFIKKALQESNKEFFEKFYAEGTNKMKPYTFSVFLGNPAFLEDRIELKEKSIDVLFSFLNYETTIPLYNAFNSMLFKKFSLKNNSMTLTNISMLPEKEIISEQITIKLLSPLVVRDHNRETKKDYYYSFRHTEFQEMLKINIREQLKALDFNKKIVGDLLNNFTIIPLTPKKVVVKFYEKQIESSLGVFELSGNPKLLEILYKAGIGSKHSAGFGMFTIV